MIVGHLSIMSRSLRLCSFCILLSKMHGRNVRWFFMKKVTWASPPPPPSVRLELIKDSPLFCSDDVLLVNARLSRAHLPEAICFICPKELCLLPEAYSVVCPKEWKVFCLLESYCVVWRTESNPFWQTTQLIQVDDTIPLGKWYKITSCKWGMTVYCRLFVRLGPLWFPIHMIMSTGTEFLILLVYCLINFLSAGNVVLGVKKYILIS